MEEKQCVKCLETKPIDKFHRGNAKQKYESQCKTCKADYDKLKYQRNSERIKLQKKRNRLKINAQLTKRRATCPKYKLLVCLRKRMNLAIRNNSKASNTVSLLGCSIEAVKVHLQTQFSEGMTWENHGFHGWHIDHIRPCASFDLSDPEQQKQCFHYTNLQPLWAVDNIRKGDRWNSL